MKFERGKSTALTVVAQPKTQQQSVRDLRRASRYGVDTFSQKLMREAGRLATQKIYDMLSDDAKFNELNAKERLRLLELAQNRAFGRVETESQDRQMEARYEQEETRRVGGKVPTRLRLIAQNLDLPEFRKSRNAKTD